MSMKPCCKHIVSSSAGELVARIAGCRGSGGYVRSDFEPPPLKWLILRYGSEEPDEEDQDAEEEAQG